MSFHPKRQFSIFQVGNHFYSRTLEWELTDDDLALVAEQVYRFQNIQVVNISDNSVSAWIFGYGFSLRMQDLLCS